MLNWRTRVCPYFPDNALTKGLTCQYFPFPSCGLSDKGDRACSLKGIFRCLFSIINAFFLVLNHVCFEKAKCGLDNLYSWYWESSGRSQAWVWLLGEKYREKGSHDLFGLRHFSLLGVWSKNLEVPKSCLRPQPVPQMISHIIYISLSSAGNGCILKLSNWRRF